jgi:hypothetical protein
MALTYFEKTGTVVRRVTTGRRIEFNPLYPALLFKNGKPQLHLSSDGKALQALILCRRHTEAGFKAENEGQVRLAISEYKKALFRLDWALKLKGVNEKIHRRLERKFEALIFKLFRMVMGEARLLEKNARAKGDRSEQIEALIQARRACEFALMDALAMGIGHDGVNGALRERMKTLYEKTRISYHNPLSKEIDSAVAERN